MHNIFAAFYFQYVAEESGPGIGTGKVGVFFLFVVIFDECLKYLCTYDFFLSLPPLVLIIPIWKSGFVCGD